MMNTREILVKAREEKRAIGAFNAGNLEIAKAVLQAAQVKQTPIIIQTSAKEALHFGMKNFLAVVDNFREETGLAILTNLDHGPDLETCQKAIELGYDLIHFDGSCLSWEENLRITQDLVKLAHAHALLLEGEIDAIMGSEEAGEINYTDPRQAADFVGQTGCDLLAVFVGNRHGICPEGEPLALNRLGQIAAQIDCFLTLHGGSGIASDQIHQAINLGVVKINVNTELRLAYKETLENVLRGSEEVAVHQLMPPVMAAVQKVVEEKIDLFNNQFSPGDIPHLKPEI
ncbi:MAG: class II fructose-bisphosphate aldolase [Candidatus Shapirobacteria bacterium]